MSTATIVVMDEERFPIVEVSGRYELRGQREDGTILLGPDTSAQAILRRAGSRPATPQEFEQALGDLPTGPA